MTCILSCHWSLCVYLPFSGERLNPPPQMFIRGGGVWVGCLVLGGWVPQNPKTPQPLINIPWTGGVVSVIFSAFAAFLASGGRG